MTQITTVIFDMYDTLVRNERRFWQTTFGDLVREQGLNIDPDRLLQEFLVAEAEFRAGRIRTGAPFQSYYEGWRDTFARAFATLGLHADAEAASRKAILDLSGRPPYTETLEALGVIQGQWRTAILSNADDDYLLPNLKLLGLEFEAVLSSEEARCYKPRPGLFHQMLRRLEVSPQECVYVGDKQFEDVKGASEVGMRTVWVNRSGSPVDASLPAPDYQVSNLLQLPGILAG